MGETNTPKGAASQQTPASAEGLTPKETLTFSQEEVAKIKTNVGRLEAELKKSQTIAERAINRLKDIEDRQLKQEEEDAKDDPARLSDLQRRRQIARRESEAEQKLRDAEAMTADALTKYQKVLTRHAETLSKEYNVEKDVLLKYGGADEDSLEELAKSFGSRAGEENSLIPDRSKTRGGGKGLTKADIAKMSPQEVNARQKEIAAMTF